MKKFIEEWALTFWILMGAVAMAWIAFHPYPPIYAAPSAKQQEAGCTSVGKVGNWTAYHCFDGYGHEFIANDAGFVATIQN